MRKIVLFLAVVLGFSFSVSANMRLENSPIKPLVMPEYDQKLARLGKVLFNDNNLSKNKRVSCHTCHQIGKGGADGLPKSMGDTGLTGRNSPTVINTSAYRLLMWDGRLDIGEGKDLAFQAKAVMTNKKVMGWSSWKEVIQRLSSLPQYRDLFFTVFGDSSITEDRVANAIAEYQTSLTAINSDFDLWLKDEKKISEEVIKGFRAFQNYGCPLCHFGPAVGGYSQQILGVYKKPEGKYKTLFNDVGLFKTTNNENDRYRFRAPSLRMAYYTAPYLHDGSIATLDEVIRFMGLHQRQIEIPEEERKAIAAWIKSLAGEIPEEP